MRLLMKLLFVIDHAAIDVTPIFTRRAVKKANVKDLIKHVLIAEHFSILLATCTQLNIQQRMNSVSVLF